VERSLAVTVDTDIAGLTDIYASAGEAELLARLGDRSSLVSLQGRQARYMAVRTDGTMLAGNIKQWPTLAASLSEQGFVDLADGARVYARATRLAPDLNLLVARTYECPAASDEHVRAGCGGCHAGHLAAGPPRGGRPASAH
jgi:hypothetical protein